ncbi:hypothetical protein, partial [Acidisphaera sp. S103]|uniref:hypothetical protein n=1 Tax=Acidisphaera sp. S103 TaxID=1747223 RepID=UPI001C20ACA7
MLADVVVHPSALSWSSVSPGRLVQHLTGADGPDFALRDSHFSLQICIERESFMDGVEFFYS